tara:strand:+ start:219 stop:1397 length:1179 start_codon:yes stop_codon:yes gene_type:complete
MALTDTKKAKEFMAGAPNIKLKGDLTPTKMMASEPDMTDSLNELSLQLFGKDLRLLTEEEMDMLRDEAERLTQKYMAEGGIIQTVPRQGYFLGKIVKGVKKAVKGVTKTVKKNPLLALAALNFAPALFKGGASTFFGGSNAMFGNPLSLLNLSGAKTGTGAAMDALKIGGTGAVITGLLASKERQPGESDMDFAQRQAQVNEQLNVQFRRLYPQGGNESDEDYDVRISALVEGADDQTVPVGNMADGGRAGYASGSEDRFMELVSELRERGFSQQEAIEEARRILSENKAMGGRIMRAMGDTASENAMQAGGIEGLPVRQNSKGVKELDLRETGGFIPPVGVKEKADDIPAMLSNNEFVFTADAVRAAGGGSVNKGAQRMYDLMKNLESKVV